MLLLYKPHVRSSICILISRIRVRWVLQVLTCSCVLLCHIYPLMDIYTSARFSLKISSEGGYFPRIIEIDLLFHCQLSQQGWPYLSLKWVRLVPHGTNPGPFQIRIQYILPTGHDIIRSIHYSLKHFIY